MTGDEQQKSPIDRRQFNHDLSVTGKMKAAKIASDEGLSYAQVKVFFWRDAIRKYSDYFIRF
jgi:hypothetical protein